MKTDLIERLRAKAITEGPYGKRYADYWNLMLEAADRLAALEADGWQAIDTAPKDRRILLGRFSGDKKDEYDTYCAVDRWRHPTAGHSYTGWGQFNATHWPPTHWREIGRPA